MYVRMWMTEDPVTVAPSVPLRDAHTLLLSRNVRRLPVVENGRLVGIVTQTDLQKLLFLDRARPSMPPLEKCVVRDVMTRDPLTVAPGDAVEHAALLMHRNRISSLPIVDGDRVVGIITETDIFRAFVAIMGLSEPGKRIVVEIGHDQTSFQDILDCIEQNDVDLLSIATLYTYSSTHALAAIRIRGLDADLCAEDIRNSGHRVLEIR